MKIPLHFRPFAAKREIERLKILADQAEGIQRQFLSEIKYHAETASRLAAVKVELDAANEKMAKVSKWIIVTHGLAHVRTAGGKPMDILKKKNENPIRVNLPSPFPEP